MIRKLLILVLAASCYAQSRTVTLNTGFQMPMIGMGTYFLTGDAYVERVVDEALTAGYRMFDSAVLYENEASLGRAFQVLLPRHGLTREDIFITTKFFLNVNTNYSDVILTSLANLQTSYIDLHMIHWPGVQGVDDTSPDVVRLRHEAWDVLAQFHRSGQIRSLAVSNFMTRHLQALRAHSDIVPAVNQVEWHPRRYYHELLDYCRANGIVLQAHSSLGGQTNELPRTHPLFVSTGLRLGRSAVQILLRWAYQLDISVIPRTSNSSQMRENMDLCFTIPQADMEILDTYFTQEESLFGWFPNRVL